MLFQHESYHLTISVSFAVLTHAHIAHAFPSFRIDEHFVCESKFKCIINAFDDIFTEIDKKVNA